MISENKVLRIIFETSGNGKSGGWRKQHNEDVYIFYSSPNVIRMIKYRRLR
jgi:hypothetical protein